MSSMLIYNSKSALISDAIQKLAIAATLGEKIKSRRSKCPHVNLIFNATTDFVWVVRDFSLTTNESADSKLNKFLSQENVDLNATDKRKEEIKQKNKIRESISNVFDGKKCFYVPVPVSDGTAGLPFEEALQSLDSIPYQNLRDNFKKEINQITDYVTKMIRVKTVSHQYMNGPLFCEYLKQIVIAINEENVIYLNDTIDICVKVHANEILTEMTKLYDDKMNSLIKAK
jgi:hypothetical protein